MLAVSAHPDAHHVPPAGFLVDRPRLTATLVGCDAPLVALVAPAGYGKTTLLTQWAQLDERPAVWVRVSDARTSPAMLRGAIARRLAALAPADGGSPVIVVVDDAHLVETAADEDVLVRTAADLPAGSILAVASHGEPPMPMGRLRLERRVQELRGADLAMTREEARETLRRAGVELDATELSIVMRQTEGWPAALVLAALAVGVDADRATAVERFAGGDRLVADYLREEFIDRLSARELTVLTYTSILDQLSGGACDALCLTHGSGGMLRGLSRSNMLVTVLDRCEESFRLHPLLRQFLQSELDRTDPHQRADLHARASAWFEERRQIARAIDHAAAAGDIQRTARMLSAAAPAFAGRGRPDCITRPLRRFSHAQLASDPALAVCMAMGHIGQGNRDIVEQWADIAERALSSEDAPQPHVKAGVAVLRAFVARDGLADSVAHARRSEALDRPDGPWRPLASYLRGAALHLLGELDEARHHLEDGSRRGAGRAPTVRTLCSAQLALLALTQERWIDGGVHAAAARATIDAAGLGGLPAIVLGYAASAFSLAYVGEPAAAERDLAASERLLGAGEGLPPWYAAEVLVALARTNLRLSNASAARDQLTQAGRALRDCPDAHLLRSWIDDAWNRSDTFAAGAVAGVSTLTTAELRVLRMLPSHLSLREIAERLHVSANTVKTQAHAVYRKLDASSRSQAVTRARSVGLVDG